MTDLVDHLATDQVAMEDMIKIITITDYHLLESLYRLDFYAQLPNDFDNLNLNMFDICNYVAEKVKLSKKYTNVFRKIWNNLPRKEQEYPELEHFVNDFIQVRFDQVLADQELIGYGDTYLITRAGKRYFEQLHNSIRFYNKEDEIDEDRNRVLESMTNIGMPPLGAAFNIADLFSSISKEDNKKYKDEKDI